eukprot:5253677-Prymnesium_polylepis.1
MASSVSRNLARSRYFETVQFRAIHMLSPDGSLQHGNTSSRGLHMSPPAHSAHKDITHAAHAAGFSHRRPC